MILRIRALLRERAPTTDGEGPGAAAFRRGRVLVIDGSATYRTFLAGRDGPGRTPRGERRRAGGGVAALDAAAGDGAFDCVTVDLLGTPMTASPCAGRSASGAPDRRPARASTSSASPAAIRPRTSSWKPTRPAPTTLSRRPTPRSWPCGSAASCGGASWRRTDRRIAGLFGERERAVERARAEADAAEARARLADALERANRDLADANRQLTEAQSKLVQAAKMASLGELVAGSPTRSTIPWPSSWPTRAPSSGCSASCRTPLRRPPPAPSTRPGSGSARCGWG